MPKETSDTIVSSCLQTAEVKRLPNKKTLVDANGRDLPAKQVSEALQKLADLEKVGGLKSA